MASASTKSLAILAALAVMLLGTPAFAQSQSSSSDPFSGVSAVNSEQMSAVSGEFAGGEINVGTSAQSETGGCAQCSGGLQGNSFGTTANDVSATGNTVRINVTAINNQTTIISPGSINTGGGLNGAGGGSAGSGN